MFVWLGSEFLQKALSQMLERVLNTFLICTALKILWLFPVNPSIKMVGGFLRAFENNFEGIAKAFSESWQTSKISVLQK